MAIALARAVLTRFSSAKQIFAATAQLTARPRR